MSNTCNIDFSGGIYSNTVIFRDIKDKWRSLSNSGDEVGTFEEFFLFYIGKLLQCEPEIFVMDNKGNTHLYQLVNSVPTLITGSIADIKTIHRGIVDPLDFS